MNSPQQPALPHAQYERFEGAREYDAMFDELVPATQRIIRIFEKSLGVSYNAPARCELLRQFLRADPLNRLMIVVHDGGAIDRFCPRFASLLQTYGHLAKVRQTPRSASHIYDPFIVFDASHYLHRFHYDRTRYARGMNELEGAQQLLERFEELWEISRPAATGGVTGL
jgi:hypothetical protein